MTPAEADDVHQQVRRYYTGAATDAAAGESACRSIDGTVFGPALYDHLEGIPESAVLASIGCGNPSAVVELRPGEVVLDLGSGGGIDVLLSAKRVGPTGHVYGIDFTPAMLELARRNAALANATNVEFLEGHIEAVPLDDQTIDVIISNCVINLAPNKTVVFHEMFRLLRPNGRIGLTDVVTDDDITEEAKNGQGNHLECVTGALSFSDYAQGLTSAGFTDVTVTTTHLVADKIHSAIIRARRDNSPAGAGTGAGNFRR